MARRYSRNILEFQISNNTQNTTLKNPSFKEAQTRPHLTPELPPGSSDSCRFLCKPGYRGHDWLVVYEAESFTLAIFISIPREPDCWTTVLHLELSLDKAHLGDLDRTLHRLGRALDPPEPEKTVVARGVFPRCPEQKVTLLAGPYEVTAALSHYPKSVLEVKLEERGRSSDGRADRGTPQLGVGSSGTASAPLEPLKKPQNPIDASRNL